MTIHLLGIIWIFFILISFKKHITYTIMLVIISIIFMGTTFFSSNNINVSIFEISSFLLLIRVLLLNNGKIFIGKFSFFLLVLIFFVITSSIFLGFLYKGYPVPLYIEFGKKMYSAGFHYVKIDIHLFIALIRFLLYGLTIIIICSCTDQLMNKQKNKKVVLKTIIITSWIVIIVGIIQFAYSYNIIDTHLLVELFHNNNASTNAYVANYDKLYSVFAEPSYCGCWLNSILWGLIISEIQFKSKKILIVLLFIEEILTISATAAISFFIMFIYWIIYKKIDKKKIFGFAGVVMILILVILFTSIGQRFWNELANKINSMSAIARFTYFRQCYQTFWNSSGLGIGYSQILSSTLISGLLAQIGLVGTSLFIVFFLAMIKKKANDSIEVLVKTIFISICIGTEISCSGIVYAMPLWFAIMLFVFCFGDNQKLT